MQPVLMQPECSVSDPAVHFADEIRKLKINMDMDAKMMIRVLIIAVTMAVLMPAVTVLTGCAMPQNHNAAQDGTGAGEETDGTKDDVGAKNGHDKGTTWKKNIALDPKWEWADLSEINTGEAVLYTAASDRKDIVIGVNAGHGTTGGENVRTYCHPDKSPKITNGTNPKGSLKAVAISTGMIFKDGTPEAEVTLKASRILRDKLLEKGYDVLMLRDDSDVRLDNVARTVIANNIAGCHVSLHWDGDGLNYDKGCFYIPVPDEIKDMEPVMSHASAHESLGTALIEGLRDNGCMIYEGTVYPQELTQTCYSTIPSAVVELGNNASKHDDATLEKLADGLLAGIESFLDENR